VPRNSPFILPSSPVPGRIPVAGKGWIHEVKFDGWRIQLHKDGDAVTLFSRNGSDFTARLPQLRDAVTSLPCSSAIIDAELVACADDGHPDFLVLMTGGMDGLCAWCFDLLDLNGRDLRERSLTDRKNALRRLLIKADDDTLRYSEEFPDAAKLLKVVEKMGPEGVVSKKADEPYISGKNPNWIKVKTSAWREAIKDRWELFDKSAGRRQSER
jgi:bifunctional non-homologous end joining protein LigD